MAPTRRLRFEILRRDSYTCRYCGRSAPNVTLEVDHVIPVALGGNDDPRNLVAACEDCNAGKASIAPDSALVEDVDATAMLFSKAIVRATELQRGEHHELDAHVEHFTHLWDTWHLNDGSTVPIPGDWRNTIRSYIEQGLDDQDLSRAIGIAMDSHVGADRIFPYFCGVCSRVLTERHEIARRLLEDGEV